MKSSSRQRDARENSPPDSSYNQTDLSSNGALLDVRITRNGTFTISFFVFVMGHFFPNILGIVFKGTPLYSIPIFFRS